MHVKASQQLGIAGKVMLCEFEEADVGFYTLATALLMNRCFKNHHLV